MKLMSNSRPRRKPSRRSKVRRRHRSRHYATAVPLTRRLGGLLRGQASSDKAPARSASNVASAGSRVLASLLALSMAGLLIWFFADYRFFVYAIEVDGAALESAEQVYQASGLHEMSIFYVNRMTVADKVRAGLLAVEDADVSCALPARVQVKVQERLVAYQWRSGGYAYLVDEEGLVLGPDDGARQALPVIQDQDDGPLAPGDRVDLGVVRTIQQLCALLPEATVFQYSEATGVSLTGQQGLVIHFGDDQNLQTKVANMKAMLREIASRGDSAQFIDVRFVGGPYYR